METKNELLRSLPKVDECLLILLPYLTQNTVPTAIAKKAVQSTIEVVRQDILGGHTGNVPSSLDEWTNQFIDSIENLNRRS